MGCLFSCFRVRDDLRPQINVVSQPITAMPKDPLDSLASKCLWSVLPSEAEDSDHLQGENERSGVTGSPVSDDGLRAEASFLKACGTLPQTPDEIRNAEKLKDSQPLDEYMESTFHSWLHNTITEKALEKQPDQLPCPIKLFEESENEPDSSPHSPNSYITKKDTDRNSTTSSEGCGVEHPTETVKDPQTLNSQFSYTPMVASTHRKTKSVRFESETDTTSFSSKHTSPENNQDSNPSGSPCDQSVPKASPYPTPLKLTNDMQTPGTVFPSYVYNTNIGKNLKIRLQYVYSGVDPEIFSRLDPPKSVQEGHNEQHLVPISEGICDFDSTPIMGTVNGDKTFLWDGNGIPNTTNKYKEDQKVRWHATPFEERLEKALAENQKQIGQTLPIQF